MTKPKRHGEESDHGDRERIERTADIPDGADAGEYVDYPDDDAASGPREADAAREAELQPDPEPPPGR